ncbi:MAG TPA: hypothetical protein VHN11_18235 [Xanthobacteraceae bacterium]|nr:hypothetical protein [Xanthobacteraceae bacterium]
MAAPSIGSVGIVANVPASSQADQSAKAKEQNDNSQEKAAPVQAAKSPGTGLVVDKAA